MANTQRTIRVRFDGDAKGLSRAARAAERDVNRFSTRASKTVRLTQRGLAAMVGTAVTAAPAILAAGAAVVAFGGLAVPTIAKVVSSQQEMGANWDSLNSSQQAVARNLTGLVDQYKSLSRQVEPDALIAFNNSLATGSTLLRQLTPLARVGGQELVNFTARLNAEFSGAQWTQFFQSLARTAPASMDAVSAALFGTLGVVRDVTGALAPLSNVTLQTVGGFARLVGGLADANPSLVQMAAVALLLRGPLIAAQNAAKTAANSFLSLETGAARANAAMKLLGKAVAVAALVVLVQRFSAAADAANSFADSVANRAPDTRSQIQALSKELAKQNAIAESGVDLWDTIYFTFNKEILRAADNSDALRGRLKELEAQQRAEAQAAKLEADVTGTVGAAMKVAADQARTMETRLQAVKVALEAVFNPSINVWNATTQLKRGYDTMIDALKEAHGNFKGNTEASQELRDAFAQQLTSVGELYSATLQQTGSLSKAKSAAAEQIPVLQALAGNNKGAQQQVAALAKSLGISADKSALNRKQFISSARQMGLNAEEAKKLWQAYRNLPASVRTRLKADKREAEKDLNYWKRQLKDPNLTKERRAKINANIQKALNKINKVEARLAAIRDRTVYVNVVTRSRTPGGHPHATTFYPEAQGGYIRGPGTGTSDSIPARLSNGEYVIRAAAVRKVGKGFLDAINQGGNLTSLSGRAANGGLVTADAAAGPMVIENHIEIGGEVVRVVRTEIRADRRNTKQRALAGAGAGR